MNTKINIVLYEPEIAGNVGSVMRTCVAINAKLHLIEPLGFFLDDRFIIRSSANYFEFLQYESYEDWNSFLSKNPNSNLFFSTRYGQKPPSAIDFTKSETPIYLVFGKESSGIPKTILQEHLNQCFRLPMSINIRSLNVANVVCAVSYEVLRQLDYLDLSLNEIQKGKDYLQN
ncbi:tRNA (cytidine(34)-2'-O)-methyltransferase [Spiroplasma endosymbiont of Agriotes lineatus]|uniref:tRNA (cytidine(34)-2'-O)-methyltransferase n=1 Tax=Spiroplasma endosymbiont of Agriotes lineatus TaxID=3077930 RepID=UPI0030CEAA12